MELSSDWSAAALRHTAAVAIGQGVAEQTRG